MTLVAASLKLTKRRTKSFMLYGSLAIENAISLDQPVSMHNGKHGEDLLLGDLVSSKDSPTLDVMLKQEEEKRVHLLVEQLKDKWQRVVVARYGLEDGNGINCQTWINEK